MTVLDSRLIQVQIRRWHAVQARKQYIAARYAANLAPELTLPQYTPGAMLNRVFIRFPIRILTTTTLSSQSAPVVAFLRRRGIQAQRAYFPAHLLPEFANCPRTDLHSTEDVYSSVIEVPSQPGLRDDQIDHVCESLLRAPFR
jgi:dTDP-4-amino-4,6-dideoxygalactose transaminase